VTFGLEGDYKLVGTASSFLVEPVTNSPIYALLLELQREFRKEVAQAVHQALAQHPSLVPPVALPAEVPTLLNVREAAALLHVSVATIHAWKRRGLLAYRKVSTRTYFERAAVLEAAQPQPAFDGRRSSRRR
jgi:DNA-directed RNA polymerase specialized sigma24 family protein